MRTPGPKLPLTGRFLSLALLLARTHREKLQEQKEVGGGAGRRKLKGARTVGGRGQGEKSKRGRPSCPRLSSGISKHALAGIAQPLDCGT